MKRRILIGAVVCFAFACILIYILESRQGPVNDEVKTEVGASSAGSRKATQQYQSSQSMEEEMPKGAYKGMADPRWPIYLRERDRDPAFDWKTPISFYGKVVDQDEQPVPGVNVKMDWTDTSRKGTSEATRVTDGAGLFSVEGVKGKSFVVISLEKRGYVEAKSSNHYAFEYAGFWEPSYHEPDPKSPVIFHLRKKSEAEPMVHHGPTLFAAPNDGKPVYFDLVRGRKVGDGLGDVSLRIDKGPRVNRRFDWTATVEAVNGAGLLESSDEFMATAPTDGYHAQWEVAHRAGEEQFKSQVQAKFFVRTGQGRFARIELLIIPDYNESAAVDFEVFLNPSGSTNLEFDSSKLSTIDAR